MKKLQFFFLAVAIIGFLVSCKKDDTATGPGAKGKTMGIITDNVALPGGGAVKNRFILLDIDHASNANKKFMTVDIVENAGGYKFQVVESVKSISDFATNFPEGVRKIVSGQGYGYDFLVSAYMKIRATSGVTRPYTFNYDSIHKFTPVSSVIIPINEMHNPIYAGAMTGKEPQACVNLWAPGKASPGSGTSIDPNDTIPDYFFFGLYQRFSKPTRLYLYFNEGMYTSVGSPTNRAVRFNEAALRSIEMLTGKADAAISYEGNQSVLFFFDFDKWEFMTIKFPCPVAYHATCSNELEVSAVKSMNTLMEWPASWMK